MADPVCNINQRLPVPQPKIASLPPVPQATDLQSALAAIRALTQIVNILGNRFPPNQFNTGGDGPDAQTGGGAGRMPSQGSGNFAEIRDKRQEEDVRIYDPNDRDVFVDVKQITGLTFFDKASKRTIVWKR